MGQPRVSTPSTPKRSASDVYLHLLASFGAKSSATSSTQEKRRSLNTTPQKPAQSLNMDLDDDHTESKEVTPNPTLETSPELAQMLDPESITSHRLPSSPGEQSDHKELEQDHLSTHMNGKRHRLALRGGNERKDSGLKHHGNSASVKMEARRRDRTDRPRRSLRARKADILESDTTPVASPANKREQKKMPTKAIDSARRRLREDIALHTKSKANNFLVANQELFLPLLPANNHISKLIASGNTGQIVEYTEIHEQPDGVKASMKPYQLAGLSFLVHLNENGVSGILGDEMGLGKTLQTLSLFQYLEEKDRNDGVESEELRPYLVLCPLSVLDSWVGEAQKWVPELKVLRFHGSVAERQRLKRVAQGSEDMYGNETRQPRKRGKFRKRQSTSQSIGQDDGSYKIIVTTYEAFQADQSWFKHSFVWRYVVLDEGHRIKNSGTQISTALKNVSAEYRLILTGTPLQNNLVEMWSLLAWLYPDVFTSNTETLFKESFDLSKGKVNREVMEDARRLLELIMLRRMKDSPAVNLGLPEKEEVLLYVPLTPMQRFWYTRLLTRVDDAILKDVFSDIQNKERDALVEDKKEEELSKRLHKLEGGFEDLEGAPGWEETTAIIKQSIENEQTNAGSKSAWKKLMNLVLQLRKCCSHPYLLPGALPDPYHVGDHVIRASGKFILLEKLLKHSILGQGKKVLIFSGFTHTLDYCEELLDLVGNYGLKFKYLRLDGGTVRARRNLDIRLFNNKSSDYKVMLLSTRAGGLGINLTSAEDVIFLDEDWNPQITLQAEARAHRIGQTKKVTIYKLCTQGTVEEQMMGRIRKKLYLSTKITESMRNIHGQGSGTDITEGSKAAEDMPQLDTSQLVSLVRRGARTLAHPDINATEMLGWDLETMLQKCRDKPSDPHVEAAAPATEVDEEQWLAAMERVECAVFDGKRYQRRKDEESAALNILPDSISRKDRRNGKNTTVMVGGYAVNKESLNCADWEAVPTLAGKDPRLAEPKREKKRELTHEENCLICFELDEGDGLIGCKSCPRSFHRRCLNAHFHSKLSSFSGFFCPQHECVECKKKTVDAGGLIFRCRWCERGYCEDHVNWDFVDLVGENLPEFEVLNEGPPTGGYYIKCSDCKRDAVDNDARRLWMEEMENSFEEQHKDWLKSKAELRRQADRELDHQQRSFDRQDVDARNRFEDSSNNRRVSAGNAVGLLHYPMILDIDDEQSPPALTETSLTTPRLAHSGVSTPRLGSFSQSANGSKKRPLIIEDDDFDMKELLKKKNKRRSTFHGSSGH